MRICVDPGHGGRDSGAIGEKPATISEKDINLQIALHLKTALIHKGLAVTMTRYQDRTLDLAARAAAANRHRADLFVSVHANAAESAEAEGMEVFSFPGAIAGRQIAQSVLRQLLTAFPDHRNRGVKEANFAVLRLTEMPAILVECEFLTNPRQLTFLLDPENQKTLAAAMAEGIGR